MDPPEHSSSDGLSGVADIDRYLWIDSDVIPHFNATVVERALITAELDTSDRANTVFTRDTTAPTGRCLVHS